jgi:GTPase
LAKAFVTRDLVNEDRLTEVHNEIDYRITSIPGVAGYEQTVQDLRDHFDAADEALDNKIDLVNTTLDTKIDDTTALLRTDINTNTADISNVNVRLTNLQNRVNTLGGHLGEFRQSIAPINDEHFHLLNGDVIDSEDASKRAHGFKSLYPKLELYLF